MKFILGMLLLLSCTKKGFEMEELAQDVIKSKRGVDIKVMPVEEEKR